MVAYAPEGERPIGLAGCEQWALAIAPDAHGALQRPCPTLPTTQPCDAHPAPCASSCWPLRKVPLELPRSLTSHRPPRHTSSACFSEMDGSLIWNSLLLRVRPTW